MPNITLLGKVVAYGTPPLLILLGYSAYIGGKFAESIFGTSEGMTTLGILMMTIGIGMGIVELYAKIR